MLLLLLMAKARMDSVDGSKNMRILVNEDPGHELVDLCALDITLLIVCLPFFTSGRVIDEAGPTKKDVVDFVSISRRRRFSAF